MRAFPYPGAAHVARPYSRQDDQDWSLPGRLVNIGLAKLRTEVEASRDYLLQVSDRTADLFAAKVAYKG